MNRLLVLLSIILAGLYPALSAADSSNLSLKSTGSVEIIGTSTIRDWKCSGKASIDVVDYGNLESAVPPDFSGTVKATVKASVQVSEIDCKNSQMDDHLRNALLTPLQFEKKNPSEITFVMREGGVKGNSANLSGDLTIREVTKPIKIQAAIQRLPDGSATVRGEIKINMRDFGVEPPVLMLGMLKVDPNVTVKFVAKIRPTEKN